MTKKIIVYNSFAHDANPHATLLKRQLLEVNKELLSCPAHDKKTLINERKLLQRKLKATDEEAVEAGDLKIGWDGVGSPEEVAYGEGYHSQLRASPYSESNLTKAWERGREAAKLKGKLRKNAYMGEVRGKRFEAPAGRDYKSERGYVAEIINTAKGSVLERSEPLISEASARRWAEEAAKKFRSFRTKAEFKMVFYDPERV